ncbi:hypothetical protein TcCL_Unassigned05505 [Trypanosoma cruzi]|nr:hypothetical protein TcCL_Unassigned05505 [Trypanosoma cruzi]
MWEVKRSTQQAEASKAKRNHPNYSYFIHQTTADAHKFPVVECWHAQFAHTSSAHSGVHQRGYDDLSSGAHTHAELLRLPSISRIRDGALVVILVGASAFMAVLRGASVVFVIVFVVFGIFIFSFDVCAL